MRMRLPGRRGIYYQLTPAGKKYVKAPKKEEMERLYQKAVVNVLSFQ